MDLKFSIITPSFNQGKYIRDCIESVLAQNYSNFEHIIMDGGSTDETLRILKEYPHLKWFSKPDSGPASAINEGFGYAEGDIYSWLNSDDYYDNAVFESVNKVFLSNNVQFISGNLTFIDENKNILYIDKTVHFDKNYFINISADILRQPCAFFSSELYKKFGGLNEELKLVFDYDLFIRFLSETTPVFIDKNFVFQRDYSTTLSRRFVRKQAIEIFKVSQKYGGNLISRLNKKNLKKFLLNKL